jgi:DNA-directed RNA polymerase subunit omega
MIDPPIEDLLDKVDSKFTLVTLASRRARQVNSYFSQLGEGLGAIVPPQVASISRKPLSIALEEIAAGKVKANYDLVEIAALEAAAAAAAEAQAEEGLVVAIGEDVDGDENEDSAGQDIDITGGDEAS